MPISSGARLGSYEVLSLLGAGGMGEVYKARNTRLDRSPRHRSDFGQPFDETKEALLALIPDTEDRVVIVLLKAFN